MDLEAERARQRTSYRLCGMGFSVYGFAMLISSLISVGSLVLLFTGHGQDIGRLTGIDGFEFLHATFRTVTRIASVALLWAAWTEPTWRRRSGLLLVIAMIDVGLWVMEFGDRLGFLSEPVGHQALRESLAGALSWAKIGLLGGLAADFLSHFDNRGGVSFTRKLRATAAVASVFWFFFFIEHINWQHPWPLSYRPWTKQLILFHLVLWVLTTVCLVQASLVCLIAGREASAALRVMSKEDQSNDPWSDPPK